MKYYIAYGSNLNITKMKEMCNEALIIGSSLLKDYRLVFRGSKNSFYLTIESAPGYVVPIALWQIDRKSEKAIDKYEGFPYLYYKQPMLVEIDGMNYDSYAYIMKDGMMLGPPSNNYLKICVNGYTDFNFDINYLKEAYFYSSVEHNFKQ